MRREPSGAHRLGLALMAAAMVVSGQAQAEPSEPAPFGVRSLGYLNTFGLRHDWIDGVLSLSAPVDVSVTTLFFEGSAKDRMAAAGAVVRLGPTSALGMAIHYDAVARAMLSTEHSLELQDSNSDGLPDISVSRITDTTIQDERSTSLAALLGWYTHAAASSFGVQIGVRSENRFDRPTEPPFFVPSAQASAATEAVSTRTTIEDLASGAGVGSLISEFDSERTRDAIRYWLGAGYLGGEQTQVTARIFGGFTQWGASASRTVTDSAEQDVIRGTRVISERLTENSISIDAAGEFGVGFRYRGNTIGAKSAAGVRFFRPPEGEDFFMSAADVRTFGGDGAGVASLHSQRVYHWTLSESDRKDWFVSGTLHHGKRLGSAEVGIAMTGRLEEKSTLSSRRLSVIFRDKVDNGNAVVDAGDYFLRGAGSMNLRNEDRMRTVQFLAAAFGIVPLSDALQFLQGAEIRMVRARRLAATAIESAVPVIGTKTTALNTQDAFVEPLSFNGLPVDIDALSHATELRLRSGVAWTMQDALRLGAFLGLDQLLSQEDSAELTLGASADYSF